MIITMIVCRVFILRSPGQTFTLRVSLAGSPTGLAKEWERVFDPARERVKEREREVLLTIENVDYVLCNIYA